MVFLENSQNSHENTCVRASFLIKLQANFIKKETLAQMFSCEFCEISKNTFFYRTLPVAVSVNFKNLKNIFLWSIAQIIYKNLSSVK